MKLLLFTKTRNYPVGFLGKDCLHIDAFIYKHGTFAKNLSIYLERSYFVFGWFTRRVKILNSLFSPQI